MLFWKLVGDGEGEGVVACAEGAAINRVAIRAANSAPTTLCSPLDRLLDGSRSVLLKMETSTVGVVPTAPLQPVRTGHGACEQFLPSCLDCDLSHPCVAYVTAQCG